jgi:hypothetical protein
MSRAWQRNLPRGVLMLLLGVVIAGGVPAGAQEGPR